MAGEEQRVAKIMAAGMCSRREAERLIEVGSVSVNGVVMREQGCQSLWMRNTSMVTASAAWQITRVILLNPWASSRRSQKQQDPGVAHR